MTMSDLRFNSEHNPFRKRQFADNKRNDKSIRIDPEILKKLKKYCFFNDTTIKEVADLAIGAMNNDNFLEYSKQTKIIKINPETKQKYDNLKVKYPHVSFNDICSYVIDQFIEKENAGE